MKDEKVQAMREFILLLTKQVKDAQIEAEQEAVNWSWVDLQNRADEIVRGKSLWKRFIDGTPLSNDIACWMADFAQEVLASHPAPVAKQEPSGWFDPQTGDYSRVNRLGWSALYLHPAPETKQEPVAKPVCNLWVDPDTLEYIVDRCDHPPSECIPVYTHPAPVNTAQSDDAILRAWQAGYYEAGYTHDQAYADKMARAYLEATKK